MGKNYYQILETNQSATDRIIQSAYRRLALLNHPNKNPNNFDAARRFDELAEAYDVLSDHKRRAIYDQYGEIGLKKGVPIGPQGEWSEGYVYHGDAHQVFRDFFGGDNPFAEFYTNADRDLKLGFGGLDSKTQRRKDPPIERDLFVSLEDVYFGAIKKFSITKRILNDDDATTTIREKILSITIRPGWLSGTKITFAGEGDEGPNIIPADLIYTIKDKPHPYYVRDQADLIYRTKISLGKALTGTRLKITHVDGRLLDILITDLVRPGYQKRLPGHGMPLMKNPEKFGDLIIEFDIDYPQTLTTYQRSLIKKALVNPDEEEKQNLRKTKKIN